MENWGNRSWRVKNPKLIFPGIYWRGNSEKIYLTFDDGPTTGCTPQLLDLLKNHSVPATFFVLGERAAENPGLIRRIFNAGHQVGNHGYWHRPHWFCPQKFIRESIFRTNFVLEKITGERPRLFRPPFGRFGVRVWQVCHALNLKIILWNLMPRDFRPEIDAETIVRHVKPRLQPRRILVFHDNLPAPDKLISSLPQIIEFARQLGLEFDRLE